MYFSHVLRKKTRDLLFVSFCIYKSTIQSFLRFQRVCCTEEKRFKSRLRSVTPETASFWNRKSWLIQRKPPRIWQKKKKNPSKSLADCISEWWRFAQKDGFFQGSCFTRNTVSVSWGVAHMELCGAIRVESENVQGSGLESGAGFWWEAQVLWALSYCHWRFHWYVYWAFVFDPPQVFCQWSVESIPHEWFRALGDASDVLHLWPGCSALWENKVSRRFLLVIFMFFYVCVVSNWSFWVHEKT